MCLRARARHIVEFQICLGERNVSGCSVAAPDRDLQRIDSFLRTTGSQVNAADQQVRLRFVWRQEHGAPKLRHRLAVLLGIEQTSSALEIELRDVLLIAERSGCQGLVDRPRAVRVDAAEYS